MKDTRFGEQQQRLPSIDAADLRIDVRQQLVV
jgi:hypothetical protein